MTHRCAILDDYQNVATKLADWSIPDVEVKVFNEWFADQKAESGLFVFRILKKGA